LPSVFRPTDSSQFCGAHSSNASPSLDCAAHDRPNNITHISMYCCSKYVEEMRNVFQSENWRGASRRRVPAGPRLHGGTGPGCAHSFRRRVTGLPAPMSCRGTAQSVCAPSSCPAAAPSSDSAGPPGTEPGHVSQVRTGGARRPRRPPRVPDSRSAAGVYWRWDLHTFAVRS
jgi:hypothetical protein